MIRDFTIKLIEITGLLVVAMLSCTAAAAPMNPYIELSVDTSDIYLGDTVILNIESTGLLDPLNLKALENNVQFLRETTGTRIAVHQGKVTEIALRRMELEPLKTGPLVMGPVTAGDVTSNSVSVNVLDAVRSDWQPVQDDFSVNVSLSSFEPYIHSQLTLDIELKHRYSISDESIELPRLDGFLVRPIFKERRTFSDDTREWRITAWRYLLFPERSGTVTFEPVRWTGTAIKSRPERAVFTRESAPLTLTIRAADPTTSGWWLPAHSLILDEAWSSEVKEIKAGDELVRTLRILATGVQSSQLPEPVIHESRALSQTLVSMHREDSIRGSSIEAMAEFVYRVKAKSPIPVFLDTVRISWWDINSNQSAEAIIPARRINVGLPDRADLLKNLALTQTGTSKIKFWLQGANQTRVMLIAVGSVFLTLILLTLLLRIFRLTGAILSNRKNKRNLRRLVEQSDWPTLYTRIENLRANGWQLPRNSTAHDQLQHFLFGENAVRPDRTTLLNWISQLQVPAISRPGHAKYPDTSFLADL